MINDHRQWLYKNKKGRIFEAGEEIPEGWVDHRGDSDKWQHPPEGFEEVEEVVFCDDLEFTEPVSDDAPEVYYCEECDKEYKDFFWYSKHMSEKHGIDVDDNG